MIRIGAFLVGLFFSGWLLVSAAMGAFAFVTAPTAPTVYSFAGTLHYTDNGQEVALPMLASTTSASSPVSSTAA